MNKQFILVSATLFLNVGCGVRGRPQPPETPPEIGRGEPTFRRATEQFRFQNVPPVPTEPAEDEDEDERFGR